MVRILHARLCFFAFLTAVGLFGSGSAQGQHVIRLTNETVTPVANAARWLDSMAAVADKEPVQVLIQFSALPSGEQKLVMAHNGITLGDYIPDNTFSAVIKLPVNKEQLLAMPVFSIINVKPEWKASDFLWDDVAKMKGSVEVLVTFSAGIDLQAIREFVAAMGGRINPGHMEQYGSYKVVIASARVRSMAQWYGVSYISPVREIVPLDLSSRATVKGNTAAASPQYGGYGLLGDSVTVGVGDNCSGIYHADLKDRIRDFNPAPKGTHGAHVNGIVGGAGIVDPFGVGQAPHVSLIDFLYDLILPATGDMYRNFNMTITNNSYTVMEGSCSYNGTYDAYSKFLDTLSVQYPDVLHVFASGNDGGMHCTPYLSGFATVGGGYQPAKNNVVVGSIIDGQLEAYDESRGPVKDGRLKPEIVAVGLVAYSTVLEDEYSWSAGTSMASPQVAGGLAALTQHYKRLNGGAQPKADVLKAVLLNGAMDLGRPGPDFTYGFGVMDVHRSLKLLDNNQFSVNTINNGDSQAMTITIPPNTAQVKVMLCWSDVPANPTSSRQLVNDLDLSVKGPSAVYMPLVLDHAPANVTKLAAPQPDHLNNVEQVTIDAPAAGTYTIQTKGYSIPYGPQRYVIAYDIIPKGLELTYPRGGEQLGNKTEAVDSIRVFWNAVTDGNTFKVEFSRDNGGNWVTISNAVPANIRYCGFLAGGVNSGKCLVRVSRNGTAEVMTSGRFSINAQPVVALDTSQCPGYVNIHWSPVLNATSYYLLRKMGSYMQVVDSVSDTAYSFGNMPLNEYSYMAVQPVIDGLPGYRSLAVKAMANSGNCIKPASVGDLMAERPVSRRAGRRLTSTAFNAGANVVVRLRNMYTTPCANYTLSYKVNSGLWQTLINPGAIPANGTADISLVGVPVAPVGTHNIVVAVTNLDFADPQKGNDTISFAVSSLPNDTLGLSSPFVDGFEAMSVFSVSHDSMGVSAGDGRWDYDNIDSFGRMRSFVSDATTITGTRSISMDETRNVRTGSKNGFIGTFNLSNYDTANAEIRIDFDYVLHGMPRSSVGNLVSVRAYDTLSWSTLYTYDAGTYPGFLNHARSLSLTDAMRQGGRNFSTACQVSFGQNDTSLIASVNYGNGMTIDNFRMYTVFNDASLAGIVSPLPANCGLSAPQPLTVEVRNGVNYTLHNIQMYYSLDGGPVLTGVIDSIKAKATVTYTFPQPVAMSPGTTHTLNVWLSKAGDSYTANDSILDYHFRNSQIISAFPYLENFEQGDGGYYSDGFKNTWQYGTPAARKIKKAASGSNAWKTNLAGNHNNLELSYLYSPCFDISQLADPMLSFSAAIDIEDCGSTFCDGAYIECSFDGQTWSRLGSTGQGTNWYDSTHNLWNTEGFTRWHVSSISLPQPGAGQTTHFRFVMSSDPGVALEGIAIDDIHVFDRAHGIYPADGETVLTKDAGSNQRTDFVIGNKLLASVQPGGNPINSATVTLYAQDMLSNPGATQYTFPRSYTVKAPSVPADSTGIRLFLTENDVVKVVNDTTCPSCNRFVDAYSLGVTQYVNSSDPATENGTLRDDTGGVFRYYPYSAIKWVPYDDGYYADFKTKSLSELWFNDGGPTGNFHAAADYLNFTAFRTGSNVTVAWYSLIDTAVDIYTPEWSVDSIHYATVLDTPARHEPAATYVIQDPVNFVTYPVFYFRLKWTMTGKEGVWYSPVRRVDRSDSALNAITFNAQMIDQRNVLLTWNAKIDGVVDHYQLERARGNGAFAVIGNVQSLHRYWQDYSYIDQPPSGIPTGTLLHYRLTAVLKDGSSVQLPVRTVEWINGNNVVNVYPNPTNDGSLTVEWHADAGVVMHVGISDVVGKHLYDESVTSSQWSNKTVLQTFNGPKGVYFMRIDIEGRRYVMKIVYD